MAATSPQAFESRSRVAPQKALPSKTIVFVRPQELSAATNALLVLTASLLQVHQEERQEQQRLAQQEEELLQQQMLMRAGPATRANIVQTAR